MQLEEKNENIKYILALSDKEFYRYLGIKKENFLLEIELIKKYEKINNIGRKSKFSAEVRVLMMHEYLKKYDTYEDMAIKYKTSKGTVWKCIDKIEKILIKNNLFFENRKKNLIQDKNLIIDTTIVKINRPKKNQKKYYSGKHKYHGIKVQLLINKNKEIRDLKIFNGKIHDKKCFDKSKLNISENSLLITDLGYCGIEKIHKKVSIPKKNYKNNPLTKKNKEQNKKISKKRVKIEHCFGSLKRFKILSTRYRNKLSKFFLHICLIAGFYASDMLL